MYGLYKARRDVGREPTISCDPCDLPTEKALPNRPLIVIQETYATLFFGKSGMSQKDL